MGSGGAGVQGCGGAGVQGCGGAGVQEKTSYLLPFILHPSYFILSPRLTDSGLCFITTEEPVIAGQLQRLLARVLRRNNPDHTRTASPG